jgi:hypothetical protein
MLGEPGRPDGTRGCGTVNYCYHRVHAIMLAIDQYAETAWVYYLNRPYSIGGMEDEIP